MTQVLQCHFREQWSVGLLLSSDQLPRHKSTKRRPKGNLTRN